MIFNLRNACSVIIFLLFLTAEKGFSQNHPKGLASKSVVSEINIFEYVTSLDLSSNAPKLNTLNLFLYKSSGDNEQKFIHTTNDMGLSKNVHLKTIHFTGPGAALRPFVLAYMPNVERFKINLMYGTPELLNFHLSYPNLKSFEIEHSLQSDLMNALESMSLIPSLSHLSLTWREGKNYLTEHEKELFARMQQLDALNITIKSYGLIRVNLSPFDELYQILPKTQIHIKNTTSW